MKENFYSLYPIKTEASDEVEYDHKYQKKPLNYFRRKTKKINIEDNPVVMHTKKKFSEIRKDIEFRKDTPETIKIPRKIKRGDFIGFSFLFE